MIIKNALLIDMNDIYRKYMDIIIRGGKIAGIRNAADGGSGAGQNGRDCKTNGFVSGNEAETGCAERTDGELILDAKGALVTPGFVEADCLAGVRTQIYRRDNQDADDALPLSPSLRAVDALDFSDEAFAMARRGGVTTAISSPAKSALIGGTCAAVKTGGNAGRNWILKEEAAYQFSLTNEPRSRFGKKGQSPMTRMGSAAMIRNALYQAREYRESRQNGSGRSYSLEHESLMRVFDGMPVKIAALQSQDIMTAVRIGEEFGLNSVITGAYDAAEACDSLERTDIRFVVGPLYGGGRSREEQNRKLGLGGILRKKGISFAISTSHPSMNLELFPCQLSLLHQNGMTEKELLAAATILPARYLGLDARIGSIEEGKDADLLIWDGEPLDYYGRVRTMVIEGEIIDME
ncbi:MAG: amidohydrolase family protein [Lachnospiraceae bacterium]|jgi:imidazolonepropionase-like amidohydrolase|nr:amidohydrolase family protein [Lachnospiraceae bacterium]NBJ82709.1 amidohydrolase [bacterium 1XD42-76]NBK06002.1 amidohydrolase [bacterium 1XD42-94]